MELEGLIIDDRVRGIFRVHRSTMTSPAILELERERIFDRVWLYLGHESEVPNRGDYRRRTIGGRPVFFVRGSDGQVRSFMNTCRHRGAMVCRRDDGNAEVFQCFYHAWTYNNKGELIGQPDEEGYAEGFDRCEMGLVSPPRVEGYRGFYFLSFNPQVEDLSTYLGGAKEWMDSLIDRAGGLRVLPGTLRYVMHCNWKLLMENSMDGYHLPSTHQTYIQYVNTPGVPPRFRRPEGRGGQQGPGVTQALENGHSVWLSGGDHLFIFPNAVWVSGPTLRTFWPVAPDYLEIRSYVFATSDEAPDITAARISDTGVFQGPGGFATPDDVEALESCQEGFKAGLVEWSDISRGMHRESRTEADRLEGQTRDELSMRTFWREWHGRMAGVAEAAPILTV